MTLVVVLDVNTLASAAATGEGLPGIVVNCAVNGVVHFVISDHILKKLDEVLQRPWFAARIEDDLRRRYLTKLDQSAVRVEPDLSVRGVTDDEEDDLVLGTAVAVHLSLALWAGGGSPTRAGWRGCAGETGH